MDAHLIVHRTEPTMGRRHVYLYSVQVDGELLVERSADPECDSARALLAKGITGILTLIDAETGKPRTRINIEKAARLTVTESSRDGASLRKWVQPTDSLSPSPEEAAEVAA
jgi:hypothetical protein